MFGSLGFTELVLILMIVLIIFGAGKLPQLGEGIGKAIKGFKKSVNEVEAMDVEAHAQQAEGEPPPQANAPQQLSHPVAPQSASTTPVQHSEAVSTSKG